MNKIFILLFIPLLFLLGGDLKKGVFDLNISSLDINGADEVLVNCSYEKKDTFFSKKNIFTEALDIYGKDWDNKTQEFFEKICVNQENKVVPLRVSYINYIIDNDFKKSSIYTYNTYSFSSNNWNEAFVNISDETEFTEEARPLMFLVKVNSKRTLYFPLYKLSDKRKIEFKVIQTDPTSNTCSYIYNYISKYEYDINSKKLKSFELENPLGITTTYFTNDYDIDELRECIDNQVWIKKYGKLSGKYCPWIKTTKKPSKSK